MKLNKLDCLQHQVVSESPREEKNCWLCKHSDWIDGLYCSHDLNQTILDVDPDGLGVEGLINDYLIANSLSNPKLSCTGAVGNYCSLWEAGKYDNDSVNDFV
jgi:hypothetical protein